MIYQQVAHNVVHLLHSPKSIFSRVATITKTEKKTYGMPCKSSNKSPVKLNTTPCSPYGVWSLFQ